MKVRLAYDNAGEMTIDEGGNRFTWDAWGHLVYIANGTGGLVQSYEYDALGRNDLSNNGSGNVRLFYSTQDQLLESRFANIYGQNVWGLGYVNNLVVRDRNADGNMSTGNLGLTGSGLEEREYYQHDKQFSTISYTNQTGTVGQRYIYDPYGTITALTSAWALSTDTSNFTTVLFQGMAVTGTGYLYISQTRLYDVRLGRWISQDPSGYVDGYNRYQMVRSNPLVRVDPSGLGATQPTTQPTTQPSSQGFVLHDPSNGDPAGDATVSVTGSNLCDHNKPSKNGSTNLHIAFHTDAGIGGSPSSVGAVLVNGQNVPVTSSGDENTDFNLDWSGGTNGNDEGDIYVAIIYNSLKNNENSGVVATFSIHWHFSCECGFASDVDTDTDYKYVKNNVGDLPTTQPGAQ